MTVCVGMTVCVANGDCVTPGSCVRTAGCVSTGAGVEAEVCAAPRAIEGAGAVDKIVAVGAVCKREGDSAPLHLLLTHASLPRQSSAWQHHYLVPSEFLAANSLLLVIAAL